MDSFFKKKTFVLLFAFIFYCGFSSKAQEMISISSNSAIESQNFLFFEDKSDSLTYSEISKNEALFKVFSTKTINFKFSNAAFWLKFQIKNDSDVDTERILALDNKDLDYIDLYYFDKNKQLVNLKTGDFYANNKNIDKSFFPFLRIKTPSNSSQNYYLRIKSSSNLHLNFTLWDEVKYFNFINLNARFIWIIIGILFLRVLLNFVLFRLFYNKNIKFYFLNIIIFVVATFINLVQLKYLVGSPVVNHFFINCFYYLSPIFLCLTVDKFIQNPLVSSPFQALFRLIYFIGILGLTSLLIFPNQYFPIQFAMIFSLLSNLFLLFFSLKNFNPSLSKTFLVAIIFLIINTSIYPLICLSILPFSAFFLTLITLLVVIEAVFMTIFIGKSILQSAMQIQGSKQKLSFSEKKSANFQSNMTLIEVVSSDDLFLKNIKEIIMKNIFDSGFGIEQLSEKMNTNPTQLRRKLKTLTGFTTVDFIRQMRLHRAAELLIKKAGTVSEIGYQVGFENLSYFAKVFHAQFGVLPSEYSPVVTVAQTPDGGLKLK